jgi:hypothetical protein
MPLRVRPTCFEVQKHELLRGVGHG